MRRFALLDFLCARSIHPNEVRIDESMVAMSEPENNNQNHVNGVPLSTMKPGQNCRVVKIIGKGGIFRRIMDIGIRNGTQILVERVAPLGDPVEFKLQGCHISLRKEESENILVEVISD